MSAAGTFGRPGISQRRSTPDITEECLIHLDTPMALKAGKKKLYWWISAFLLYSILVPITFISIGVSLYLMMALWITINGLEGPAAAGYGWLFIYAMLVVGAPISLLAPLVLTPLILGWLRKFRVKAIRRRKRLQRKK